MRERKPSLVARVPPWLRAGCVTALVLAVSPLGGLDDIVSLRLLEHTGALASSSRALRVRVEQDVLRHADCGREIARALRAGGASSAVQLEPLQWLCPVPGARRVLRSEARLDATGQVTGWRSSSPDAPQAFAAERWVRPLPPGALPTLEWRQLESGQLSLDLLRGRQVLLVTAWEDSAPSAGDQLERSLAAALSGEGSRREVPPWLVWPAAILLAMGWALAVARRGYRAGLVLGLGGLLGLVGLGVGLAASASVAILPLASLAASWLCAAAFLLGVELVRERRAFVRANELVERAVLSRVRGLDQLDDGEFHAKIASLADQWHPANLVLVAQLAARQWHLQFWKYGGAGEELIDERRRDIRRTPYCDEQGLPKIRVVRNYLVMKEMPVLVVPLMALGEIEGYVFLCGERAEAAHLRDASTAARLSLELALIMRRRRLGRASADELSLGAPLTANAGEQLASGARVVGEEMFLLDAMVRDAPIGLMLADSFGHVRKLSQEFAAWLTAFGATLPPLRDDASLPAGALTLSQVFEKLFGATADAASQRVAELVGSKDGLVLPLMAPASHGGDALVLRCRPLRRTTLSVDHVTGFVLTLGAAEGPAQRLASLQAPGTSLQELSAFPLATVIREVIVGVHRALRRQVLLEPSMTAGYCIGKQLQLTQALRAFLTDAAAQQAPVLVMRERERALELTIHDLDPGIPAGAIERVLEAPHHPPPGLESLARLLLAVEDSHGSLRVVTGRGWGSRLILRLHRARAVVMVGPTRATSALVISEGQTRTSIPPARRSLPPEPSLPLPPRVPGLAAVDEAGPSAPSSVVAARGNAPESTGSAGPGSTRGRDPA